MSPTKVLVVAFGILAVLTTVSGTAGFDTATVERGIDIRVADDDQAYIGVDACVRDRGGSGSPSNESRSVLRVEVTNRFAEAVTVSVLDAQPRGSDTLSPGETTSFTLPVDRPENDEVRVSVEGQSVEATLVSETTPCGEATTD
ncbi:hypothetical protein [Haloprofundus sp. MHR1]|uniref:hypothetical protein n=1 Tax=Haloprofundus sp. MHR1 TaxID=2572921 RepID=UPI0010BED33A|nr:hypothetical protein [Haloprofundus sp. MHR1]QCJ48230.1 hypothetical protein FCF25_14345 [Haloprofundus sp. MHR1]